MQGDLNPAKCPHCRADQSDELRAIVEKVSIAGPSCTYGMEATCESCKKQYDFTITVTRPGVLTT